MYPVAVVYDRRNRSEITTVIERRYNNRHRSLSNRM